MSDFRPENNATHQWQCTNPKCAKGFAEYVNGCPCCETGEVGGSHKVAFLPRRPQNASKGKPS